MWVEKSVPALHHHGRGVFGWNVPQAASATKYKLLEHFGRFSLSLALRSFPTRASVKHPTLVFVASTTARAGAPLETVSQADTSFSLTKFECHLCVLNDEWIALVRDQP